MGSCGTEVGCVPGGWQLCPARDLVRCCCCCCCLSSSIDKALSCWTLLLPSIAAMVMLPRQALEGPKAVPSGDGVLSRGPQPGWGATTWKGLLRRACSMTLEGDHRKATLQNPYVDSCQTEKAPESYSLPQRKLIWLTLCAVADATAVASTTGVGRSLISVKLLASMLIRSLCVCLSQVAITLRGLSSPSEYQEKRDVSTLVHPHRRASRRGIC